MKNKNQIIRVIAVICVLTVVTLTVLPGCSFIGQTTNMGNNTDASVSDLAIDGNAICCPVCSSTDLTGPDADGYYVCNNCGARWKYDDTAIDVVNDANELVTTLDLSSGFVSGNPSSSGSSGGSSYVSGGSSSGNTTNKVNQTTTTKVTTTKSMEDTLKEIQDRWKDVIKFKVDEDGNVTADSPTGKDTGLFGFKYSTKDKVFITAEDAWQRNFGFEVTYDSVSGLGSITYDTVRVYFNYNGLDYMFQFWKGQYGFVFIGSEIGIYHRPEGKTGTYYDCATDETKLTMSMDVYRKKSSTSNEFTKLFSRSPARTWWLTGFTPGTLQAGSYFVDEDHTKMLKVDATICFPDAEMAEAFMGGLNKVTEILHNSPSRKRSISYAKLDYSAYASSTKTGKYAVEDDGKTVHVSWR